MSRPTSILVVDDDRLLRIGLVGALRALGYDVEACSSGESAVRTLVAPPRPMDVVLLDLRLGGLGGRETFERIRASGVDVPVVFMSGSLAGFDTSLLGDGTVLGALTKPFRLPQLVELIGPAVPEDEPN